MCVVCMLFPYVCQYIPNFLGSQIKSTVVLIKKLSTFWRKTRRQITTVTFYDIYFHFYQQAVAFEIEILSFFQNTIAMCVPLLEK